jgi:predicted aspartyl protease
MRACGLRLGLPGCLLLSFAACAASGAETAAVAAGAVGPRASTNPVVLPFELRRGHVMVPVRVTDTNAAPLSLLLDTGYSMTMLHPNHVAALGLRRAGHITIVGIAGEEPAEVFEGPSFDFSGAFWKPRRVAAFPDTAPGRGRRRDGILGSGFFRRFVVEIDSLRKQLLLHEPGAYHYGGDGQVLPLRFAGDTPVIDATVRLSDDSEVTASFEVDTGCDSCLCVGRPFVTAHSLAPADAPGAGGANRFGVGGGTRTHDTHFAQLRLGRLAVSRPAANLFLDGSPVDPPQAGHIGWDLLQRFKVIFDYSRRQMILEPAAGAHQPP